VTLRPLHFLVERAALLVANVLIACKLLLRLPVEVYGLLHLLSGNLLAVQSYVEASILPIHLLPTYVDLTIDPNRLHQLSQVTNYILSKLLLLLHLLLRIMLHLGGHLLLLILVHLLLPYLLLLLGLHI